MGGICRRCGANAVEGRCPLCGSTDIDGAAPPPLPPVEDTVVRPQSGPSLVEAAASNGPARSKAPAVVIGVIGAVAVLGIVGGVLSTRGTAVVPSGTATRAATNQPAPAVPSARTSAPSLAPATVAQQDPEEVALAKLTHRAAGDGARVTRQGQWMAQLASKYVGVTDPRLVTAAGSHTFLAADIWAEFEQVSARVPSGDVVLLDSRTYGKRRSHDGEALWVVAVLSPSFTDEASVKSWCARLYPSLSGAELTNVCMPNRLNP